MEDTEKKKSHQILIEVKRENGLSLKFLFIFVNVKM